jgi:hypothetical protein
MSLYARKKRRRQKGFHNFAKKFRVKLNMNLVRQFNNFSPTFRGTYSKLTAAYSLRLWPEGF